MPLTIDAAYFLNDTASNLFNIASAAVIQAGQHFATRLAVNTKGNLGNGTLKEGTAYSSRQGYLLKTHSQLEDYGANGYRQLQNGRMRYYEEVDLANVQLRLSIKG